MKNMGKRLWSQKKRLVSAAVVLAALALVCYAGSAGLPAAFVEQSSWHLLQAEAEPEGIRVITAGENLVLHKGVRVRADSQENKGFSAANVRDGISDEETLRWSSANDWENNEHWLEIGFGREVTAGVVRIYWERTNACSYAIEYSDDGKRWLTAAEFAQPPADAVQDIYLDEPVQARYLRLHVTEVTKEEADLSLYYQNVSVLELEVYEGVLDSFLVKTPEIPAQSRRKLVSGKEAETDSVSAVRYPEVPAGYELEFVGADYDMLVEADGRIADNIAGVWAELGFALVRDGTAYELPGMSVYVPPGESAQAEAEVSAARDAAAEENGEEDGAATAQETAMEAEGAAQETAGLPEGCQVMEWVSAGGTVELTEETRVVVAKEDGEELLAVARLLAKELSEVLGRSVEAVLETEERETDPDAGNTDICLCLKRESFGEADAPWIDGLGDEGYEIRLGAPAKGGIQIEGTTAQGVRWGCVTFLSLLENAEGGLPEGRLRDYPRYSVRGFGIDVGRRPVSMELLYRIVREMSEQKMNTLQVHLNDNQIIAQSDYDGTVEGAYGLYSAFRLESGLQNEAGEGITASDLYYTKEEFAQFIADAAVYGVEVVPEIDTPAHSLSITKVFPELGLSRNPESADQLDLSKPEAAELVKTLWGEYLGAGAPDGEAVRIAEEAGKAPDGEAVRIAEEAGKAPDGEADQNAEAADGAESAAASETAIFGACGAVHIGMDEYFGDEREYISYLIEISDYIKTAAPDKDIRIWGSLSKIGADHSGVSTDLQMHIWDTDWADPQDMYDEGFSIINSLSSSLYIIPGGGYDRLDQEFLEEKWQPNIFETKERTWVLPSYSPKMLGAVYMMWNDWSHLNGEDITEDGLFERFSEPLPVIAGKLWGGYEN